MSAINNLRKLGRDPKTRNEAREYCKLHIEEIMKEFPKRVLMSDGAETLDCLLNCMPTSALSQAHKSKVLDTVLSRLRNEATGLRLCSELVCRVCLELPRTTVPDVLRIAEQCLHSLIHDEDVNMIWRDVLPECLSVICEKGHVVHCGTEMSSEEYKAQCVRALCQCRWQHRGVVQLAAMFRDMQLDRDDHAQVVKKLCTVMLELPPETVPPLLHQLLNLCSVHNLETVLAYLGHYFNVKLYGRLQPTFQDSDSTNMDIEDCGGHTTSELRECVSTCVYHATSSSSEQLSKLLKNWPRSHLLHNPFLLEAALALADSSSYKTICLSVVKSAIHQRCTDDQKRQESAWVRSVLPSDVDVTRVLKVIISDSTSPRHLTACGLINLAFSLLATSPMLGRERIAHQSCSYAKLILVRLAKSQSETAEHILSLLSDRLQENSTSQKQCADCLMVLCKLTPNHLKCTQLCSILENCQAFGEDFRSSAAVIDAVYPMLNYSNRVRDTLVMVCRKGLFSRDSPSRCLALWGFLSLLRHMKLPAGCGGGGGGSELYASSDQFSANSYLTQISISVHTTQLGGSVSHVRNEAVCREVVSILRRCFHQDAPVKQLLYGNIYACARQKTGLHGAILELLYEHLMRYMSDVNGLDVDKCVQVTATNAVLTEPIGYLLLAIQQFLQAPEEEESEDILGSDPDAEDGPGTKYFKNKLRGHMDRLCEKYTKYQMSHFEMEGEHGLSDLTPESKAKALKIQQTLHIYEALMAYRLVQWRLDSEAPSTKLYSLFTVYTQLLDHAKTPGKMKKGPKALNETRETQKTAKTQKTQKTPKGSTKGKEKAPAKLTSMVKEKAAPFKQLPCLWDLSVCYRVLELLYSEDVAWSSSEQRGQLRTRRDFHQFTLSCLQSVLSGDMHISRTAVVAYVTRLATLLYTRCIARFQDMCDFNEPTALACVESFRECLLVAYSPNHSFNMDKFLQKVTGEQEEEAGGCLAAVLECVTRGLQQLDAEVEPDVQQDAMSRRLTASLLQLASLLLDKHRGNVCDPLRTVIGKLEQHLRTAKIDCVSLIPSLLAASCRYSHDGRLMDDLIVKLTAVLGKLEEEESEMEVECDMFPAIVADNAPAVHGYACAHLIAHCAHAEYVLARAKQLNNATNYLTHHHTSKADKELLDLDKSAVVQLCLIGSRVAKLASLHCTVGAGSDRMLQAAVRLYTPLTALVTRLQRAPIAHIHTIRLERALSTCGRKLSTVLDSLITYVESQAQQGKEKVLRDTRILPKLVFAAEQFSRNVVLLAKKTKLNLQQYLSLGTARDFRIMAGPLAEALQKEHNDAQEQDTDALEQDMPDGDASNEVPSLNDSAGEGDESEEEARPGTKRRRRAQH